MSWAALVLAGSRGETDPVATSEGLADKALVDVGGTTMLARVVSAIGAAGGTRIAVSANAPAVVAEAERVGALPLPAEAGPSGSTAAAFAELGAPLLVTTADHALLRGEWITAFLAATPPDADIAVLLARRDAIEVAAPGSRRTYLRFADGDWSGCNLFYLATPEAAGVIDLWQMVERDRKRPWRIVLRMGPGLLIRYLMGRLTLAAAVEALGRRAGVRAVVVAAIDGLAAVDVDRPDDLAFVRTRVSDAAAVRSTGSASPR